ncbi:hypothetical protein FA15DRAFT_605994, partial [Coprinopsis marcescibilis]
VENLPRKHASLINQIITGHIPLAKHLFRIGKADHPACTRCHEEVESVQHYLLHCPATRQARQRLQWVARTDAWSVRGLLKPRNWKALFAFISDTCHFYSIFGEIPTLA